MEGYFHWILINLFEFVACVALIIPAVVLHELGHLIAALMVGIPVRSIVLGGYDIKTAPLFYIFGVPLHIERDSLGGRIGVDMSVVEEMPYRALAAIIAGPAAHVFLALVFGWLALNLENKSLIVIFAASVGVNLLLLLHNLKPKVSRDARTLTDGGWIKAILTGNTAEAVSKYNNHKD